jgi:hypothetical protein
MRTWQDIGETRRWAATPSPPLGGGSREAGQIEAFGTSGRGDGNHFGNLSGNPMDG